MSTIETQSDIARTSLKLPRHVAIIMDGNGRWAKKRFMPRFAGHKAGVEALKCIVRYCANKGIDVLTMFAFSSENWRRPQEEVSLLMDLLLTSLKREVKKLHDNNVKLRIIGDHHAFSPKLSEKIKEAEQLTQDNTGLILVMAINYGGRWDITQATRRIGQQIESGDLSSAQIDESLLHSYMALHDLPEPDLFIRTGGEQRVSNFLLWQLAYTELYFTDTLWPNFKEQAFEIALDSFARRQRRFGHTGEQMERPQGA